MEQICNSQVLLKTRLYILYSLVFFIAILFACNKNDSRNEIHIVMENGRATGIFIPLDVLKDFEESKPEKDLLVRMKGKNENMLGEYKTGSYGVLFKPLIELSAGGSYQIFMKGKMLSELVIPQKKNVTKVLLNAIYPSADTLPENLLKVYLQFSKPMRQGVSGKYLSVLNNKGDTLSDIFLNLDTELWDEEGRQLTIWLNPGRIKRGLQPNEKEGNPLMSGNTYMLNISGAWTDLDGNKLDKPYTKQFTTSAKDVLSPDPALWKLNIPASGSKQALTIYFNESLDHLLLTNTITVIRRDGQEIKGRISVKSREKLLLFYPEDQWAAGIYYLKIDTRLEDLAGNNINRLFDRDLLNDKATGNDAFYTRQFVIIN